MSYAHEMVGTTAIQLRTCVRVGCDVARFRPNKPTDRDGKTCTENYEYLLQIYICMQHVCVFVYFINRCDIIGMRRKREWPSEHYPFDLVNYMLNGLYLVEYTLREANVSPLHPSPDLKLTVSFIINASTTWHICQPTFWSLHTILYVWHKTNIPIYYLYTLRAEEGVPNDLRTTRYGHLYEMHSQSQTEILSGWFLCRNSVPSRKLRRIHGIIKADGQTRTHIHMS